MATDTIEGLSTLYETDETAWLEAMAALVRARRYDDLDFPNLAEYLRDMARRDRREVKGRLAVLIAHLLEWEHQPERRSGSWRGTVVVQRQELAALVERGVLRAHAEAALADAYAAGVEQASAETGLPAEAFPAENPYGLEQLLSPELPGDS